MSGALWIARSFHLAMIACLVALATSFELGWLSWIGIAAIVLMLAYEHSLVKASDLSRVDAAFFTVNGYVSVLFFLFWAADIYFLRPKGVF
jgi:4-hydroxybenzoate polyprenyltransferase